MGKKQARKGPRHVRTPRWRPEQLSEQLQAEWRRSHPNDLVSNALASHIDRARGVPLPEDVTEDSLAARAMFKYFDVRVTMTPRKVAESGERSPSAATQQQVLQEFIPDMEAAHSDELIAVMRGVGIAKAALQQTRLHYN